MISNIDDKVFIVGAFHEIIELAELNDLYIVGLVDNIKSDTYRNYQIIGNDETLDILWNKYPMIISPDIPKVRKKLVEQYKKKGFSFYTLVSKNAIVSKSARIGLGSVVQSGVNISSACKVGQFVKINTNVNIMHDNIIGDYTTIAPNAVLLGYVEIGQECYIGSNCTVLPNIKIGDNSIVGAGAVVTKNVGANETVVGIPARVINR